MSRVGVVTIAHGRQRHLEGQHRSLAAGSRLPDDYLVVAMDDESIESCTRDGLSSEVVHVPAGPGGELPLATARNHGVAELLLRGVDVVVLLDVDCLAGGELVAAYTRVVTEHPDRIWSGPVTYLPPPPSEGYPVADPAALAGWDDPHPARPAPAPGELVSADDADLFWSLSFAIAPTSWTATGGFCEDYLGYGGEDTDFAQSALAAGVDLGWVGAARAFHQHHPISNPPVEHLDAILRNGRLFHRRWGRWPMTGWLHEFERRGLVRHEGDHWFAADPAKGPLPRRNDECPAPALGTGREHRPLTPGGSDV